MLIAALLLEFVFAFIGSIVMGQIIHMYIHTKWAGPFHRSHMAHHIEAYPPRRMITDEYMSVGRFSTVYAFVCASIPPVAIIVVLCALSIISVATMLIVAAAMLSAGLAHDIVHDSFHVKDHWLSRVMPGYATARRRHFIHHVNMKKNFGIFTIVIDRLFGTASP